jgi:hypothetical protein
MLNSIGIHCAERLFSNVGEKKGQRNSEEGTDFNRHERLFDWNSQYSVFRVNRRTKKQQTMTQRSCNGCKTFEKVVKNPICILDYLYMIFKDVMIVSIYIFVFTFIVYL